MSANRTIYLPDEQLWIAAKRTAAALGENVSVEITRALAKYVEENRPAVEAVEKARRK